MIEIKPKLDHNINIAGLLLTDADTFSRKASKAEKGAIKGLRFFSKKIPTGTVYIVNGVEFPNAEAVDLLLYLIWHLEKNGWEEILRFKGLNKIVKDVFGVKKLGQAQREKMERLLTIWKFHGYYFPGSFVWKGQKITMQFGVISNWKIISQSKGKPALLEVEFDRHFVEICKNTDWYRRPNWIEVKKLRKEIAKNLYLLALEYKPSEDSKEWKIYIDTDIKYWYRNTLNSLANPQYLYPKLIIEKRLRPAIEEINKKTSFRMELQQTKERNYCILVKEVTPRETKVLKIPFDELPAEDKTLLVAYVEAIADRKRISNVWGFLRSMSSKEIEIWLSKAREYFRVEVEKDEETDLVEKSRLLEILREWGRRKLEGKKAIFNTCFGDGKLLRAYESNKKVVFVCIDEILATLLSEKFGEELKAVFGKEVVFTA